MKILVVNGYNVDSKQGKKNYHYFIQTIKELFQLNEITGSYYIEREVNELSDYVVDWEHEQLHYQAELNCERFDELDFIFIGGDMTIVPWEPKATQVVSLVHMARYARKPLLGIGFGAFAVVYTLATMGARYHILNGPNGGRIEQLPDFPYYSVGSGAFPSGWLDQETGDIYAYDRTMKGWLPVCNTGIHFVAAAGRPISKHVHSRGFDRPIEDKESLMTGVHEADEDTLKVTNLFLASPLVSNNVIPASKTFPVRLYHNWYFNIEGALPTGENLFIMAEGKYGPSLLMKDRMLLISGRLEPYINVKHIKGIMQNFITEMLDLLLSKENGRIDLSLYTFLFEKKLALHASPVKTLTEEERVAKTKLPSLVIDNSKLRSETITTSMVQDEKLYKDQIGARKSPRSAPSSPLRSAKTRLQTELLQEKQVADHTYDTAQDRKNRAIPLSKQFIPSRVKNGPVKVDPPVLAFFQKPIRLSTNHIDPYALTGDRKSSSIGRRPRQVIQNPVAGRQKRLALAFKSLGIEYNAELIRKTLDQTEMEQQIPEYARDLLAGVVMKENNITMRRHHFKPGGSSFGSPHTPNPKPWSPNSSLPPTSLISGGEIPSSTLPTIPIVSMETSLDQYLSVNAVSEDPIRLSREEDAFVEEKEHEDRNSQGEGSRNLALEATQNPAHTLDEGNPLNTTTDNSNTIHPSKPLTASVTFKETDSIVYVPEEDDDDEYERDNLSFLTPDQFDHSEGDEYQVSPTNRPQGRSGAVLQKGKVIVPAISDWMKIYEQKDIMETLIAESERISRGSDWMKASPVSSAYSQSARGNTSPRATPIVPNPAVTARPPQNTPITPQPPTSSTSSRFKKSAAATRRTLRTKDTSKNVTSILQTAHRDYYLPIRHPQAIAKPTKEYLIDHSFIAAYDPKVTHSPLRQYEELQYASLHSSTTSTACSEGLEEGHVVFLPNQTKPHQSNYLQLQKNYQRAEIAEAEAHYQGLYSQPYLSQREKEIKEYNQAKEKFLAGNFKTMFHHDTLELRKEGLVRPFGAYPKYPGPGYENLTAADWNLVKRDQKEEFLFGAWKK